MTNRLRFLSALLLVFVLNACAVIDRRDAPAPVEDRGRAAASPRSQQPAATPAPAPIEMPSSVAGSGARASVGAPPVSEVEAEGSIAVAPYKPADTLAMATSPQPSSSARPKPPSPSLKPQYSPAAEALVEAADQAQREGDLDYAAVALERALRIEPRNPWLWNRLARVRLSQGRYAEAADLAAKSTALAGPDSALKRDNWQLVAQSKRAQGDTSGARAADRQAAQLTP
jgi:predicted Zn-dependent protease